VDSGALHGLKDGVVQVHFPYFPFHFSSLWSLQNRMLILPLSYRSISHRTLPWQFKLPTHSYFSPLHSLSVPLRNETQWVEIRRESCGLRRELTLSMGQERT
jgi:hypothetical protein